MLIIVRLVIRYAPATHRTDWPGTHVVVLVEDGTPDIDTALKESYGNKVSTGWHYPSQCLDEKNLPPAPPPSECIKLAYCGCRAAAPPTGRLAFLSGGRVARRALPVPAYAICRLQVPNQRRLHRLSAWPSLVWRTSSVARACSAAGVNRNSASLRQNLPQLAPAVSAAAHVMRCPVPATPCKVQAEPPRAACILGAIRSKASSAPPASALATTNKHGRRCHDEKISGRAARACRRLREKEACHADVTTFQ
jgi:hypothetical protein